MSVLARLAVRLIESYQRRGGGARLFGVECNFTPSCSEYTRQAILRFRFRRGVVLGWRRLWRCNRRDQVGVVADPVPDGAVERRDR